MNSKLSTHIYTEDKNFLNFRFAEVFVPKKYIEETKKSNNRTDIIIGFSDCFLLGRLAPILFHMNRSPKNTVVMVDSPPSNLSSDEIVTLMVRIL